MQGKKITWVDGFEIRNTTDSDFVGYSSHLYNRAIPPNEVWIENCLKHEEDQILHVVSVEEMVYAEARAELQKHLKRTPTDSERFRTDVKAFRKMRAQLEREAKKNGPLPTAYLQEKKRRGTIKIEYVDGSLIRKHLDPFFFHGGHDLVYSYVPKRTVWIDFRNYLKDLPFVLAHELKERKLMKKGMPYASAHDFAIAEERRARRAAGFAHFING